MPTEANHEFESMPGPAGERRPVALLEAFATLDRAVAAHRKLAGALGAVTATAVDLAPGVRWASITRGTGRGFTTMAATGEVATAADRLQYELQVGPCVAAVIEDAVLDVPDLAGDPRWVPFGARAAQQFGIGSVLSQRLHTESDEDLNAGLNLYADRPGAFDDTSRLLAGLLATHATPAVLAVLHRERADNLTQALDSNREIGVAMGIVMAAHKLTREQAFDLLRIASQTTNRKLREVATEVADTGRLTLPPPHRPAPRPRPGPTPPAGQQR